MHVMVDGASRLWKPQGKSKLSLDRAWEYVRSVTYQVCSRWVFYRLLQDGVYRTNADHKRLIALTSDARKAFYGLWRPDTLADETRDFSVEGDGYQSVEKWYEALARGVSVDLDKWASQSRYIVIMYEARAMTGQFRQYVPGIKWRVAKHLAANGPKISEADGGVLFLGC